MFKLVVGNPRLLIKEMFPIIIPVWHIIININIIIIIIVVWHLYFNLAMWVVIRTQRMFSISITFFVIYINGAQSLLLYFTDLDSHVPALKHWRSPEMSYTDIISLRDDGAMTNIPLEFICPIQLVWLLISQYSLYCHCPLCSWYKVHVISIRCELHVYFVHHVSHWRITAFDAALLGN